MKITKAHKIVINLDHENSQHTHIYEENGWYEKYERGDDKSSPTLQHAMERLVKDYIKSVHDNVDEDSIVIKIIDTEPFTVKVKYNTVTTTYAHKLEIPKWHRLAT